MIARVVLTALVWLTAYATHAAAPVGQWWYTNFDHRYKINVPAGASALTTGYAVSVTFNHAAAVTAGESLASGDDVRVVYWNGTTWIELDRVLDPDGAWNAASTTLWFKTQAGIATGVTDDNYYLYYGDTLVANTPLQDPEVVFSMFDDFSAGFDTARWTRSSNANVTVAGGVMTVNGGGRQVRSVATFGLNTIFEVRSLVANTAPSAPQYYLAGDNDCTDFTFDSYIRFRADNTAVDTVNAAPGTTAPVTATFTPTAPTTYQLYSFTREAAGAGRFFHNGAQVATFTGANTAVMCMFMRNEAATTAHTMQYEWARVRPYRNPEPVPSLSAIEALAMPAAVAEWRLDQTTWNGTAGEVVDSGTNGLNGTSFNGPVTANATPAIAGDPGTCRYGIFDGVDDYLQVADNAALDLPNQVSVSAWVYPRSLPAAGLLKSIWSKDENYEMHLNSAGQVDWWWGGGTQELITTVAVPLNQWSHIVVTYQSGMQRIYVNGVLRASGAVAGTLTVNTDPFQIGQDQAFAGRFWDGRIDEVRIYGAALSAAQVNTVMTATHPCSTAHHFLVAHDGYGITCAAVENVTVTVHDIAHGAVTGYNQSVTLDTQTGRGTWTLVSGAGTFLDATANDGLATYTWPATQSTATFALDYRSATPPATTPPGVLTFNIDVYETANPALRDDDTESSMTFSPNGFVVTSAALTNPPPNPIPAFATPQIAGTPFNAYVTAYGQTATDTTCGVIEGYTGVHSLRFWPTYANPASGTVGITVDGVTSGNSEATATTQNVTFVAGQSNVVSVQYKDVGQIAISVKDTTTGNPGLPTGIRGNSSNFVVKPSTFSIAITRTDNGNPNPGATTATDPVFIPAGQAFTVAVTSRDSTGSATPNFGLETPAETVRLTSALALPAGGQNPALTGSFTSVASGVVTGTNFAWGEVGILNVTPRLNDGNYLGSGDVVGSAISVGRFIPFNFGVTQNSPAIGAACAGSGYAYLGQPLTYSTAPVLSLTARAVGGGTTQNYQGAFFKLTNTSSTGRAYATNTGTLSVSLPANDPTPLSLGNGLATLTFNTNAGISYVRSTLTPDLPFTPTLTLSLNILDTDGVAASSNAATLSTNPWTINSPSIAMPQLRYGRIAFRNAVGSELLNLPISMRAEYFQSAAAGFVTNTADNCTNGVTLPTATNWTFGGNLASGETCLLDTGSPGTSLGGCPAAGPPGQQFRMPPLAGDFGAILLAPGAGNTGTVTITADVPTWLLFDWNAATAGDEKPSVTAVFGIYQGETKRIFQIEK